MPDILHCLPIRASIARVFGMFATPDGLNEWWTLSAAGVPAVGEEYHFDFGPGYEWRGIVSTCEPERQIEWELTRADPDWTGTRVGVQLSLIGESTLVDFHHVGWHQANGHYRTSSCCWAMYLRILRRRLEYGECVAYDQRLDA